MANKISRRDFLRKGGIGLAAATVVPNVVLGKSHGHTAPSDKLNIAGVGVGGRGASVLKGCESQNIVALCDTDWNYAKKTFNRYPNARRFWDYRTMLDQVGNTIDAVVVGTADHTHCLVASDAITMGTSIAKNR